MHRQHQKPQSSIPFSHLILALTLTTNPSNFLNFPPTKRQPCPTNQPSPCNHNFPQRFHHRFDICAVRYCEKEYGLESKFLTGGKNKEKIISGSTKVKRWHFGLNQEQTRRHPGSLELVGILPTNGTYTSNFDDDTCFDIWTQHKSAKDSSPNEFPFKEHTSLPLLFRPDHLTTRRFCVIARVTSGCCLIPVPPFLLVAPANHQRVLLCRTSQHGFTSQPFATTTAPPKRTRLVHRYRLLHSCAFEATSTRHNSTKSHYLPR